MYVYRLPSVAGTWPISPPGRGYNRLSHKPDATKMFQQFLAETRADGAPSKAVIVLSDGGGEFRGGL